METMTRHFYLDAHHQHHHHPHHHHMGKDVDQHVASLKARLGFARFKLRNGWENNTLLDVETFWKERQRQMVDALPTPRFTQRDILDNRTLHPHYHYQSPVASNKPLHMQLARHQRRHSHQQQQQKRKRAKLTRSHSSPITSPTSPTMAPHPSHFNSSAAKGKQPDAPSSPPALTYTHSMDFHHQHQHQQRQQPKEPANSLHYLSYAIDVAENRTRSASPSSQDEPPSPVTAAAEAMLMFGHHQVL
ncbi:hypothetical protein BC940DRAFT_296557 [Gongronella butleri]|nr:hypothetical protein BC940DRAFT_296557 [Gongronella butleri]